MKRFLLAATFLAAFPVTAVRAACTLTPVGSVNFISGCSADNQANDGDDIKMFVDKTVVMTETIDGSLGKNDQAFQNVMSQANADFETDGSGFANFLTVDHGQPTNTLTAYTFTPILPSTLPNGITFPGFDGQLFRGQVDNISGYDGDLSVTVNFSGGGSVSHVFTGLKANGKDFGVLGFDEIAEPGVKVGSVVISLAGTGGAFNEFKQIEFSVPGQIAVPEPSTWVMLIAGFGLMGMLGWRRGFRGLRA
jgi:hypothetical protein